MRHRERRQGLRIFGFAVVTVSVLAAGCTKSSSTEPSPTTPTPPVGTPATPVPTGDQSGRIDSLDTAADLITYNQAANVGLSIPVEGPIQRATGIITRWELPVPVYPDPSVSRGCVEE